MQCEGRHAGIIVQAGARIKTDGVDRRARLTRNGAGRYPPRMQGRTIPLVVSLLLAAIPRAEARITKIVFTTVQSPTFGGTGFGTVGTYEKLAGRAFGEVDPDDPRNATITDLASAPRNAAGKVEYSMDVYLLKPVDMTRASRRL